MKRRNVIRWTARLLIGGALGFGLRMVWERKPAVRFATGLAMHSLRGTAEGEIARPSHLQAGVPVRFSLDEITMAAEPAVALRTWREAFAAAGPEARQHCLTVPVEASLTALRRCLTQVAKEPTFRREFQALTTVLSENVPGDSDPELLRRSFAELARMDAALALDGAEVSGDEGAKQAVWLVIAEDNPQRVLDLVASGQAPAEAMQLAIASLAARSPNAAEAALQKLPAGAQSAALDPLAHALAAVDPIRALSRSVDDKAKPDPEWVSLLAKHVPATKAVGFLLAIEKDCPELLRSSSDALTVLASAQARHNPEFALGWFQRCVAPGPKMSSWVRELLDQVAREQPRAAAEALAGWPASQDRKDASARIAGAWMGSRPIEALEWMSQQDNSTALFVQGVASRQLQAKDAAAVAGWFSKHDRLTDVGWGVANLAGTWALDDPTAAMAWAQTLPDPINRGVALGAVSRQWMTFDPMAAEAHLRGQAGENLNMLIGAGGRTSESDPPAIQELLFENLPALVALLPSHPLAEWHIERTLIQAARNPETRDTALRTLVELPDPKLQQKILLGLAQRNEGDLSFVRRVASMMTDQAKAAQLIEDSVQRTFFP